MDDTSDGLTGKTSMGMDEKLEGLLCYALGWVTGLVFFIAEKESRFVKFHAMQSMLFFFGIGIVYWILGFIPYIGWILAIVVGLGTLVLWIVLMMKAYSGQRFELPIIGEIARKQAYGA